MLGRQKEFVRACRLVAKPVIVATQMLDSMVTAPTATLSLPSMHAVPLGNNYGGVREWLGVWIDAHYDILARERRAARGC